MPAIDTHPLRLARLAGGVSQVQLAEKAGVTRGAIAAMEEGRTKKPNTKVVEALAQLTGKEASALLAQFLYWRDGDVLNTLSQRATFAISLDPIILARYKSFRQWREDVAPNPTAFASLLRVSRVTVVKYERDGGAFPKPLYSALIRRLNMTPDQIQVLTELEPSHA